MATKNISSKNDFERMAYDSSFQDYKRKSNLSQESGENLIKLKQSKALETEIELLTLEHDHNMETTFRAHQSLPANLKLYLQYESWLDLNQDLIDAYRKLRAASDAASTTIDAIIESEVNSWPGTGQLMKRFDDENNERERLLSVVTHLKKEYDDFEKLLEQKCPIHHIILETLSNLFKPNIQILQP